MSSCHVWEGGATCPPGLIRSMTTVRCTHLLGQGAGLLRGVEDFIVEDREVECQAQPDGVCWLHVLLADVESVLVGLLRVLHCICATQSITDHLLCRTLILNISLNSPGQSHHRPTCCASFETNWKSIPLISSELGGRSDSVACFMPGDDICDYRHRQMNINEKKPSRPSTVMTHAMLSHAT